MNDFAKEAVLAAESRFLDKHFDLSIFSFISIIFSIFAVCN
jgi:hypothetical protein